jgi:methylated-DNA-[protein]-cysteine S-methyltransferase
MEKPTGQSAQNLNTPSGRHEEALDLEASARKPGVDACDVACDAMPGLVLGDLDARDKEWVVEHTRGCGHCARMLGGYQQLDRVLDRINLELNITAPAPKIPTGRTAAYGEVESPVGPLLVASSEQGVCEIAFGRNETQEQFLHHLRTRGYRPVQNQQAIATVATQLQEYFRGERNHFEVPLDVSGVSPFTQEVLKATAEVPFGHLTSYRGIAERIGQPSATRAVGNALGRNPIPVIIPCHRIVRSDSSLGGYTGGVQIKERLLTLEGVMLGTS